MLVEAKAIFSIGIDTQGSQNNSFILPLSLLNDNQQRWLFVRCCNLHLTSSPNSLNFFLLALPVIGAVKHVL